MSGGHIRDLPKRLGIDLDTLQIEYEELQDKRNIQSIKALGLLWKVVIATDPLGEAIANHLAEVLGLKKVIMSDVRLMR